MRVFSYENMIKEYQRSLDIDDIRERMRLLSELKYSIIIELSWLEFESLEKWIKENLFESATNEIWYGKTGYDFGFVELFFNIEEDRNKLQNEIPNIYTLSSNESWKSDGYDNIITFKFED